MDMIGHKYNRWTVIAPGDQKYHWKCQCDCGVTKEVAKSMLLTGGSKSCGCLRNDLITKRRRADLVGKKFEGFSVRRFDPFRTDWECVCDCGKSFYAKSTSITKGATKSCGCRQRQKKRSIFLARGDRFGDWSVVEEVEDRKPRKYLCRCECCGVEREVYLNALTQGASTGCGKKGTAARLAAVMLAREARAAERRAMQEPDEPAFPSAVPTEPKRPPPSWMAPA